MINPKTLTPKEVQEIKDKANTDIMNQINRVGLKETVKWIDRQYSYWNNKKNFSEADSITMMEQSKFFEKNLHILDEED